MSQSHSPQLNDSPAPAASLTIAMVLSVVAGTFVMLFLLGFISTLLKTESDVSKSALAGLYLGISGVAGVICIGITTSVCSKLTVPSWVLPAAGFSVGLCVMNGLNELLLGNYAGALGKAGGGFVAGLLAGLGLYWAQRKGWIRNPAIRPASTK